MKAPEETGTSPERVLIAQREPGAQGRAPDWMQEKGCLFFRAQGKQVRAWGIRR